VPCGPVHLDRELDLVVGGVQKEHLRADTDPPLLHEGRHSRGTQDVQATPDLQLALATVGQKGDELEQGRTAA
jgi:hypothetical protein